MWSLTFMMEGRKHVERIPEDWVDRVRLLHRHSINLYLVILRTVSLLSILAEWLISLFWVRSL